MIHDLACRHSLLWVFSEHSSQQIHYQIVAGLDKFHVRLRGARQALILTVEEAIHSRCQYVNGSPCRDFTTVDLVTLHQGRRKNALTANNAQRENITCE